LTPLICDSERVEDSPAPADEDLDWVADRDDASRPSLRNARIGWPSIVTLLVLVGAAGLGAASLGGWFGVALIVLLVVLMLGLMYVWCGLAPEPAAPESPQE
jgi:fatty acid desaturase